MEKKRLPDIQITELYLVKAGKDWKRTYMAEIKREVDTEGNPVIRGKVRIEDAIVWGCGGTEEKLSFSLDSICLLKLDYGLHKDEGITMDIAGQAYFLN